MDVVHDPDFTENIQPLAHSRKHVEPDSIGKKCTISKCRTHFIGQKGEA